MPVRSLITIPTYFWIPPIYSPEYKIELETSGGTKYDITDRVLEGDYTDGVTETIGSFRFKIDNSDETYTSLISLYDYFNIYLDYSTSATTLRFKGVIEKISTAENNVVFSGRSTSTKVVGITVTKSYSNQFTHDVLQDLINSYATYITQTNINTNEVTDTQVTVNWYQKPFWEAVLDLCNRSGYDAYIDASSDMHYFVSGSLLNTTEAVIHESNLMNTGDFAPDSSVVKNRVIVYGASIEEQQIVWTEEDATSIGKYKVKELIINDSNIITEAQAEARAEYELSLSKDPPIIGEVTSLGLVTLAPGEKVRISDPMNGINPNYYAIQKFAHKFSNDEPMQTVLTVTKEISTLPKILKRRIVFETESPSKVNPYELRYSWLFDFNTDTGTHSGTQITGGRLKATGASGTWISPLNPLSSNAISCEMRVKGEALPGTLYYVSVDNGILWQSINLNSLLNLSPPGQNLKIKVEINSASTQIDALSLLYKN